jgi:hypothetical protein
MSDVTLLFACPCVGIVQGSRSWLLPTASRVSDSFTTQASFRAVLLSPCHGMEAV